MTPNYVYSESTVKPSAIELGSNCAYLRKDIIKEERTDSENNTTVYWTYQEAFMTTEEFNEYISQLSASNTVQNVSNNDNQMAIMEAIADIYTILQTLM